ncbi:MAG: rod shape-determining protein RodA [Bacteroidota bacterium]
MREPKNIFSNIDRIALLLFVLLVGIGWVNIYAAAFNEEHRSIFDLSQEYGKQFIWILVAFLLAFFIMLIDPKFFSTFAYPIYGFTLLMLVLVLFLGKEVNGSRSWIYFTETIRFQPSEFAKFAVALTLAKYLGDSGILIQDFRTRVVVIVLMLIPAALILLQNETGSVLVFTAFIFVLYREGLSGNVLITLFLAIVVFMLTLLLNIYIIIGTIVVLAIVMFFFIRRSRKNILVFSGLVAAALIFVLSVNLMYSRALNEHQRKRIDVLIGKDTDLKGAGYNVNQSKIAIGSGGLLGKGFLHGTQTKYKFVPEQNTDFIFCTIGEEWGFFGTTVVIGLFLILLIRLMFLAERQRSMFGRIYGYGVASILFFHLIINVGMTIGLAPVVGIPLPYISYGGSSMLAFTILLFVFLKQDANRLNII